MKSKAFASLTVLLLLSVSCGKLSPEDQLIDAAATGNIAEINRLLSLGINVNCVSHSLDKSTPLIWAVRDKKEQAVLNLLAAGADPNKQNGDNRTALFYAFGTEDNLSNVITALISAGARTDEYGAWFLGLETNNPNRIAFERAINSVKHGQVRK